MTNAWTKGPWKYRPVDGRLNQQVTCMEEIVAECNPTRAIATVTVAVWKPDGHKSGKANAYLIAAAPDMAEALEEALGLDSLSAELHDCLEDERDALEKEMQRIHKLGLAALAKARGEAP